MLVTLLPEAKPFFEARRQVAEASTRMKDTGLAGILQETRELIGPDRLSAMLDSMAERGTDPRGRFPSGGRVAAASGTRGEGMLKTLALVLAVGFVVLRTFALDILVSLGLAGERFQLLIGIGFLAVVFFSSDGLLGLWRRFRERARRDPVTGERRDG